MFSDILKYMFQDIFCFLKRGQLRFSFSLSYLYLLSNVATNLGNPK